MTKNKTMTYRQMFEELRNNYQYWSDSHIRSYILKDSFLEIAQTEEWQHTIQEFDKARHLFVSFFEHCLETFARPDDEFRSDQIHLN